MKSLVKWHDVDSLVIEDLKALLVSSPVSAEMPKPLAGIKVKGRAEATLDETCLFILSWSTKAGQVCDGILDYFKEKGWFETYYFKATVSDYMGCLAVDTMFSVMVEGEIENQPLGLSIYAYQKANDRFIILFPTETEWRQWSDDVKKD